MWIIMTLPVVIKADGLAQGKGVLIAHDARGGASAIVDSMEKAVFGEAGKQVLIEQFLRRRRTDDHGVHRRTHGRADVAGPGP